MNETTETVLSIIGEERLSDLIGELGGVDWYIPTKLPEELLVRAVRRRFDEEISRHERIRDVYGMLAREFHVCVRTIRQILADRA